MRVTMTAQHSLTKMTAEDKVRAVYLHACLRYVSNEHTNNASIRERFSIDEKNKAVASRLIKDAVQKGAIKPYDPNVGARAIRYVPFWAGTVDEAVGFVDE